jgi:hypothetical protein
MTAVTMVTESGETMTADPRGTAAALNAAGVERAWYRTRDGIVLTVGGPGGAEGLGDVDDVPENVLHALEAME